MFATLLALASILPGAFALAVTKQRAPSASDEGSVDLVHNASFCLSNNASTLVDDGQEGVFATCELPAGTLLGEFRGKTYTTPWQVPNDGAFAWKIPVCGHGDTKVIRRSEQEAWYSCGSSNGFNYIDAADVQDTHSNPLRDVQHAKSQAQRKQVNTDLFLADRRIYYYTTNLVKKGEEIIIGADLQNWAHARGWHAGTDPEGEEAPASWGRAVSTSRDSHPARAAPARAAPAHVTPGAVPRTVVQTKTSRQLSQNTAANGIRAKAATKRQVKAPQVKMGGISQAPVFPN